MKNNKSIWQNLRKSTRIAGFNPKTFEEKWRFSITPLQFTSVLLLFILSISILTVLAVIYTPLGNLISSKGNKETRDQIEQQYVEIVELKKSVEKQNNYISNLQNVILGKNTIDSALITPPKSTITETTKIDTARTENELLLAQEIENISEEVITNEKAELYIFTDPVKGVISQKFDKAKHPGIDIVSSLNTPIKACLEGTVVFSGYSEEDGNFIVLSHKNGFSSYYKHTNKILKKSGERVQTGDPIALVGNSGENTSGPHLHFELWENNSAIDPLEFLSFGN
ncbi:MAG: M23 family metallopeptidase [Lishizhenia sp.]